MLVADLDLDQRRDWLELFPFLTTRRPDAYGLLTRSAVGGSERLEVEQWVGGRGAGMAPITAPRRPSLVRT